MSIASEQEWSGASSIGANDLKASNEPIQSSDGTVFNFKSLATMLRISFDKGSYQDTYPLESLRSITLENTASRALSGDFTLNLKDLSLSPGTSTTSSVKIVNSLTPMLSDGKDTMYAVISPGVKKDDRLLVTVETSIHKFTFTLKVTKDFGNGTCYDLPIDLGEASTSSSFKAESIVKLPTFSTFRFESALNKGAVLDKEVYYDSGSNTTVVKSSTGVSAQIGGDGNVSVCIPYLYNFNLVPSFTLTDND